MLASYDELLTAWPMTRRGMSTRRARMETVADASPPLSATVIRGGARTLNLQARCPVRAFCEIRLNARPLPPLALGLRPPERGIATHRALELLLTPPGAETLRDAEGGRRIEECATRALAETFGGARRALAALFDLERAQLRETLAVLLRRDRQRRGFAVEAVERQANVELGAWSVTARIDRLDRLEDGRWAIIDYKTGTSAQPGDWFGDRLWDTQIPLYAQALGAMVAAAVTCRLTPASADYRGLWSSPGDFPGQSWPLPEGRSWIEQLHAWRAQLTTLVTEFAGGDTRLLARAAEEAAGALAPLTRVHEAMQAIRNDERNS
jgi:RecB family exonuclease